MKQDQLLLLRASDYGSVGFIHPLQDVWRRRIIGAQWTDDLPKQQWFDPEIAKIYTALADVFKDGYAVVDSWSRDRKRVLLFDGDHSGVGGAPVGDRIFGTFSNVSVLGAANPLNYHVVYDQPHGDILLTRVPEPGTALLFSLGLIVAIGAKRRTLR